MVQRPPEREPADRKQYHGEYAHRNPELGFVHALVALREAARDKVAERAGCHAEQASEQGAREEEAVLRDVEAVGWRREDLGERVGGANEEGLRGLVGASWSHEWNNVPPAQR